MCVSPPTNEGLPVVPCLGNNRNPGIREGTPASYHSLLPAQRTSPTPAALLLCTAVEAGVTPCSPSQQTPDVWAPPTLCPPKN